MGKHLRHPFGQAVAVLVVAYLLIKFGIVYLPPLIPLDRCFARVLFVTSIHRPLDVGVEGGEHTRSIVAHSSLKTFVFFLRSAVR